MAHPMGEIMRLFAALTTEDVFCWNCGAGQLYQAQDLHDSVRLDVLTMIYVYKLKYIMISMS